MDIANALVDALFSQCRVGVGVCDGEGRLQEFNATLESMIGPALCRSAQQEWAPVRVNAVSPGVIDTPQYRAANEGPDHERWKNSIGVGAPDDVVGPLMFLLSEDLARYVRPLDCSFTWINDSDPASSAIRYRFRYRKLPSSSSRFVIGEVQSTVTTCFGSYQMLGAASEASVGVTWLHWQTPV